MCQNVLYFFTIRKKCDQRSRSKVIELTHRRMMDGAQLQLYPKIVKSLSTISEN